MLRPDTLQASKQSSYRCKMLGLLLAVDEIERLSKEDVSLFEKEQVKKRASFCCAKWNKR